MAARTWPKKALEYLCRDDAWLGYVAQQHLEGASQTFLSGWPVVITSGLVVEAANPVTSVWGFTTAAATGTTGADCLVIPAMPEIMVEANFLASSAADNVLAAADMGTKFRLAKSTTLLGASSPGWYIEDTGSTQAVRIVSFWAQQPSSPTVPETHAYAGDTNARVIATVLASVNQIFAA